VCGRCLTEDEGVFKEDSVLCPRCDWRRTVGLKSPRRRVPSTGGPPPLQEQAPQPEAGKKKARKKAVAPSQTSLFLPPNLSAATTVATAAALSAATTVATAAA